jgi:hypothetical protein
MSPWRTFSAAAVLTAALTACSSGDDGGSADTTSAGATAVATTAAATSAAPTTAVPTSAGATTAPTTTAAASTAPATTLDDSATGDPELVAACSLLDAARIEGVLGGPVSDPDDLDTSCEWTVGEQPEGGREPDTLTLTVIGPAEGQATTRELLADQVVDVPQAADGGVYWADYSTLFFDVGEWELSLQFLAPDADDPLGGLVALANRVG